MSGQHRLYSALQMSATASLAAENNKTSPQLIIALLLVWVVWGSTYNAIKVAVGAVPPLLMMGMRFLAAGAILYPILRLRGTPNPTRKQWLQLGSLGAIMLGSGSGAVAFASQWVSSGLSATVIATSPIWFAIIAGLMGKWPNKLEWLGIIIGFSGAVMLNLFEGELRGNFWAALALFLGPIGWVSGSLLSQKVNRDATARGETVPSGPMNSAMQLICGGVLLVLLSLLRGEQITWPIPISAILAWAYLVIFGSLIAFSAYIYTLRRARPALVSSYAFVNPIVATAIGVGLQGERLSPISMVAMAIVLVGVLFITLARR